MKKQLMKIFTCLLFIAALTATGSAGSSNRTVFEIDFDFVVRDESFTAGKYSLERLSPSNPEIMVLKQVGGKAKSVLLIRQNGDSESASQLSLRFKNSGGSYFLVGIWAFGKKYALDSELDERRRDSRQPAEPLSFVLSPDIFGAA